LCALVLNIYLLERTQSQNSIWCSSKLVSNEAWNI